MDKHIQYFLLTRVCDDCTTNKCEDCSTGREIAQYELEMDEEDANRRGRKTDDAATE